MDIKVYRKREFEQREARLKNAEFQKLEKTNKIKRKSGYSICNDMDRALWRK